MITKYTSGPKLITCIFYLSYRPMILYSPYCYIFLWSSCLSSFYLAFSFAMLQKPIHSNRDSEDSDFQSSSEHTNHPSCDVSASDQRWKVLMSTFSLYWNMQVHDCCWSPQNFLLLLHLLNQTVLCHFTKHTKGGVMKKNMVCIFQGIPALKIKKKKQANPKQPLV